MHRVGKVAALTGAAVVLTATAAAGHVATFDDGVIDSGKETHAHDVHDAQHGGAEGHIEVENYGVELVSKLGLKNVEPGKIADVGVLGSHAYVAAWGGETCTYNGVHVVDISDVTAPREVAFVPSKEGSYPGEGVQAVSLSTPAFTGDVLVTNNEQCKPGVGVGGVNLYDITKPSRPTPLIVGYGDDSGDSGAINKEAHEIHSAFAWDAGDRAFVVLVDNEEGADLDILDITNPKKPFLVAEYDLDAQFPEITDHLGTGASFLHDMVVKQIDGRQILLASYWDGGYVTLDVTDPARATRVADSDFPLVDPEAQESGIGDVTPEGNAHQAEFTRDNRFIVAADEDFSPVSVVSQTASGTPFEATVGSNTVLEQGQRVAGTTRYVGQGCDADALMPPAGQDQIALIQRGACTFTEKITNAQDAGYTAAVVFNSVSGGCRDLVNMSSPGPTIPAFFVGRDTAFDLLGLAGDPCVAVPEGTFGQTGQGIVVEAVFDGWGYVHLYGNAPDQDGKLPELDTYAVPEAHDPTKASGFGDLSVHEVAMSQQSDGLGYVSYYAAGLRVIDVSSGEIVEKGAFIDSAAPGGNNFWGVEAFTAADGQEYVAASDRDFGLYLFKHVPAPAAAEPRRGGKK